nr:hypothetical protein [Tanacetum cinerariifolium]
MPPKPDLVFNTAPTAVETDHPAFNVQLSPTKLEQALSHTNRPTTPIIEDWVETSIPAATPKLASSKPASCGKRRNRKACFMCKSVDPLIKDCDFHANKIAQPTLRNHAHRGTDKPVSAAVPKIKVTRPRHANPIVTKYKSPIRRHLTRSSSPMTSNSPHRVTTVKALVETKIPNTRSSFSYHKCINDPKKDKGVIDSRCSRHMTGNMSYLSDFEYLNGGYVAFGGNPKGGKISRKGKIKTGKLDFDDVYFVKELKFNLFSISQMCDKKNSVLFTDTKCLVLSPKFKLPDDSRVLLRDHRENNMYNVNLKNIVPSRNLTCLFAKATIDESNLWHRRLAHINFKTINKLVKGNLIRGLPTKVFENDHTCVACKKGKQQRASFTDDYSRFTWVFFLANKDETSPILKTFITYLENQLSLKCAKNPQQNGIAERKNKTLIEAAITMLEDSLLTIPFWAKAVNTACYVQNRVLVTKPHNKTPYELLHGKTPSIDFMRPFCCPVTILNTLDSLRKFEGKVDEGFLVGYSVSSKAFRVFNSRTCIVQETLHVNFLGSFQDYFDAEKPGEEIDQQYVLFHVWSSGSTNPQNNDRDAAFNGKEHDFDVKQPESEVNVSPSSSAQSRKQDDKTKKEARGKSHVESFTGYRDLSAEFEDCSDNSINELNAIGTIVPTVGQNTPNSTNTFSAAGPSNAVASSTYGKSSFIDASQLPDDPDMPKLEDITYSDDEDDVGAEDDFNNLEICITVKAIPTTRVYKDHPVSQIIGDLSSTNQTRSMTRVVQDQGGLLKMFNDDFRTCLQVKQKKDGIFISEDKYIAENLRKFGLTEGKSASTPIDTEQPLLKDPDVKQVKDVTRLQALVDRKKVEIKEATIREALRLDDAEGVDCLPNEEIFAELARMGYEKPSTKLNLVRNVDSTTKFYMYPYFLQLIIRKQVGDLSTHTTKYASPALTQKEIDEEGDADEHVEEVNTGDAARRDVSTACEDVSAARGDVSTAHGEVRAVTEEPSIASPTPPTPPPQPPQDIPSTSQ